MSIDWFTVVAQILNFLILVWLLKRFLYQPILDAIDAREQRIADELRNADTKQREAQKEREALTQKNAEFEQQKHTLMREATQAADTERKRLITSARKQADSLEAKRRQALEREQQNIQAGLRGLVSDEVFAIARKALTDLAGASLEHCITETFIARLQAMEGDVRQTFVDALSGNSLSSDKKDGMQVCSAFDLQPQQKSSIQTVLNTKFSTDIPLQFETNAKVISGIRLSFKGQQISWSIDEYLASLERDVGELLQTVGDKNASDPNSEVTNSELAMSATAKSEMAKKNPPTEITRTATTEVI